MPAILVFATSAVLLLGALPAVAAPSCGSDDLSWLAEPAATAVLAAETTAGVVLASSDPGREQPGARCSAVADCSPHADVSCSSGSGTCVGVDRNCPNQRGYVTCNGVTTYCPPCGGGCTDGSFKTIQTQNCCGFNQTEKLQYKCINGVWVFQSTLCGFPACEPWLP